LARASAVHDLVAAIEHFVQLPPVSVPRLKLSDFESIEHIASEVRSRWSLPAGPVESVVRELERNGCVVIQQDGFEHAVDAYSVRYPEHAIVVLGKTKGSTARSRFDAAHELAHLVLHDDSVAGTSTAEKQANSFAASFLMPAAEIAHELPQVPDWDLFVELKIRWRVSIGALLYRARTLGVMDEHNYTKAMKTMSARGWRKQEPGDRALGAPEQPVLLNRAAKLAFENGETIESISELAALPPLLVEQLLDSGGDSRPVLVL
jgi:Zn-dependent peptidase ImmA (M78 family)